MRAARGFHDNCDHRILYSGLYSLRAAVLPAAGKMRNRKLRAILGRGAFSQRRLLLSGSPPDRIYKLYAVPSRSNAGGLRAPGCQNRTARHTDSDADADHFSQLLFCGSLHPVRLRLSALEAGGCGPDAALLVQHFLQLCGLCFLRGAPVGRSAAAVGSQYSELRLLQGRRRGRCRKSAGSAAGLFRISLQRLRVWPDADSAVSAPLRGLLQNCSPAAAALHLSAVRCDQRPSSLCAERLSVLQK